MAGIGLLAQIAAERQQAALDELGSQDDDRCREGRVPASLYWALPDNTG